MEETAMIRPSFNLCKSVHVQLSNVVFWLVGSASGKFNVSIVNKRREIFTIAWKLLQRLFAVALFVVAPYLVKDEYFV